MLSASHMPNAPHDALEITPAERLHYASVVASMAAADVRLDRVEIEKLRALCAALELSAEATQKVVDTAHLPTASLDRHLEPLKSSRLRFALLTDCISLAFADGEFGPDERREVASLADALGVSSEQVTELEVAVKAAHDARGAQPDQAGAAAAAHVVAAGVPLGALAAVSALGLSSAGAASGLAAVGMGIGIASGVGAAVGLGIGTFMGVRWLRQRLSTPA